MNPIDSNLQVMAKAMTLRLQRHSVIAGNIANADTPGYRPSQVSFEEALQKSASKNSIEGLSKVNGRVELMDDGVPRADGNSVNMDKQMASLAENTIVYNATAEFIARKFKMIKSVIG